jgi:hypothetical protein
VRVGYIKDDGWLIDNILSANTENVYSKLNTSR